MKLYCLKAFILVMVAGLLCVGPAVPAPAGDDNALKVPRFVSLGKDEIFARTGPSLNYPIRWVYKRRGLPVEIIMEYDTWRQIRDVDGGTAWVHQAMLSGHRTVAIKNPKGVVLRVSADDTATPVVQLDKGVIAGLESCAGKWCRIEISGFKGWAPRSDLWGVYASEEID